MSRSRVLPAAVDVLVAGVAAVIGSGLELADPDHATKHLTAPVGVYVAAQVVAAAFLLARRRYPYTVALSIAAISLFVPAWAALLAPYAVTAHGTGSRRRQWGVIAALTASFLFGAHAWAIDDPVTAPAVIICSALLGLYVRARGSLIAELTDRAERAERERLLLAEQARAEERLRLAGEMHDVVTHRINLLVLQAGALRVSTTDPAVRATAEEMRTAGCHALAELRDLVGVLRDGSAPAGRSAPAAAASASSAGLATPAYLASPAGPADLADLADLAGLVDESRAVGLAVRLDEQGDPAAVAPAVRRTLFRVVQESLTNVHKHAPGAGAVVTVRYGAGGVRATIANTSPDRQPDADVTATGGGSGLDGLRHRVEVVGGTLAAGADPDGGFLVDAALPAYVPTTVPPAGR
ncbi:sensor histidine kinase [Actinoplanes sp. DH11]|uniref:sensor histidine kinase n=1 Tax=Actinoplanes sp. DH11 TaxID=2857011 RepID=UPI001E307AA1|nr:histidine kinase [Actinoplanes sp. DH11]